MNNPSLQRDQFGYGKLHNRLLDALPSAECRRLLPYLEQINLPLGEVLHQPGELVRYLYFPIDGILSLLYLTDIGDSTEICIVGNEGVVGLPAFVGDGNRSNFETFVQGAGSAWQLDGALFKAEFHRSQAIQDLMLRYLETQLAMIAQTAVCNRFHSVDQQLCRWLLLSLDRLPSNHVKLLMTQELIANMLGVCREEVSRSASKLQRAKIINYKRGEITVLDRSALERACCKCYSVVKKESDRLLPGEPGGGYAV